MAQNNRFTDEVRWEHVSRDDSTKKSAAYDREQVAATSNEAYDVSIADLWRSTDLAAWNRALERYWNFVRAGNMQLEQAMEKLDLERIRQFDAEQWYDFLRDEYFRWKYTAPNRYATTTHSLAKYKTANALEELHHIKCRLLEIDREDIRTCLSTACEINGLGTAGASGLLSLMHPEFFGTIDQFAVKALREVGGLPEDAALAKMNPQSLTIHDGVILIGIMKRKATENSRVLGDNSWTPRKIDKILWTYGRS